MKGCRPLTEAEVALVRQSFGGRYGRRDHALGSVSDLHLMGLNPQAKFVPIDEQTDDKIMHLN
jgi:hypothetical protein